MEYYSLGKLVLVFHNIQDTAKIMEPEVLTIILTRWFQK